MITLPKLSTRISATTLTATVVKNFKSGSLRGYGSNLAVLGNLMATDQAARYASIGQNIARAHHLAVALRKGWMTVLQVSESWTNLQNAGVRVCMDLVENLGELTPWGLQGFKERLCHFDPEAEKILEDYIQDIESLLKHPALFMVGIINECGGFLAPETMRKLRERWLPIIKAFNSKVMVYTTNDVHVRDSAFINVVAEEDAFCVNFYPTEDFATAAKCSYINEKWHLDGVKWLVSWLKGNGTPKPVFVTEFGSWNVNPFYLENELAVNLTAAQDGWSTLVYAYSTGSPTDKYAIESDEDRLLSLSAGALIHKNRTDLVCTQGNNKFSAVGAKIEMPNRSIMKVGGYVYRTDPCPEWGRLVRAL